METKLINRNKNVTYDRDGLCYTLKINFNLGSLFRDAKYKTDLYNSIFDVVQDLAEQQIKILQESNYQTLIYNEIFDAIHEIVDQHLSGPQAPVISPPIRLV